MRRLAFTGSCVSLCGLSGNLSQQRTVSARSTLKINRCADTPLWWPLNVAWECVDVMVTNGRDMAKDDAKSLLRLDHHRTLIRFHILNFNTFPPIQIYNNNLV